MAVEIFEVCAAAVTAGQDPLVPTNDPVGPPDLAEDPLDGRYAYGRLLAGDLPELRVREDGRGAGQGGGPARGRVQARVEQGQPDPVGRASLADSFGSGPQRGVVLADRDVALGRRQRRWAVVVVPEAGRCCLKALVS